MTITDRPARTQLDYQTGFGNDFATEALPGALPVGQNSPQRVAYGLYAEQLSGTPFTAPRHANRRSWLYRIQPSVKHEPFRKLRDGDALTAGTPNQLRWDPWPIPSKATDFVDGVITICGNGDPAMHAGIRVHIYAANRSMTDRFFYDADGELLLVPQQGALTIRTELGILGVTPGEICVIPRGVKFRVDVDGDVRGYICENFGELLRLPERGLIGANGLANSRDFETPIAAYEDRDGTFELAAKFLGQLWTARIDHSPLDVVAWHGN